MSQPPGEMPAAHVWVQCADVQCRLRFPMPTDHAAAAGCPRCQGPLADRGLAWQATAPPSGTAASTPSRADVATEAGDGARPGVEVAALLDNVRSARNVGAMLRTADAMGVSHLHLAGITSPAHHPGVAKTALGAQHAVAWSSHLDGPAHALRLQTDGWEIWAMEEGAGGHSLAAACSSLDGRSARIVLVVGHEVAGIDPAILAVADRRVAIPMRGTKRSLNVATAFGIAAYTVTTRPPTAQT